MALDSRPAFSETIFQILLPPNSFTESTFEAPIEKECATSGRKWKLKRSIFRALIHREAL